MSKWASDCSIALLKRAEMSNEQMRNCPTLQLQGWAFIHFENEQSLIFALLLFFVALFKRAKEQSLFLSLFLKERKSDCSHGCSFEKSDCSFALLQRAQKRAIAHSLFLIERMSEQLLNHSFEKSGNEGWANERMSNCPTLENLRRGELKIASDSRGRKKYEEKHRKVSLRVETVWWRIVNGFF